MIEEKVAVYTIDMLEDMNPKVYNTIMHEYINNEELVLSPDWSNDLKECFIEEAAQEGFYIEWKHDIKAEYTPQYHMNEFVCTINVDKVIDDYQGEVDRTWKKGDPNPMLSLKGKVKACVRYVRDVREPLIIIYPSDKSVDDTSAEYDLLEEYIEHLREKLEDRLYFFLKTNYEEEMSWDSVHDMLTHTEALFFKDGTKFKTEWRVK